ncbi:hypothetical protein LI291_15980, partial [Intestinibacillus massiliensis]|nr:hypothetical protein [Intestinibacillus massiliensis]
NAPMACMEPGVISIHAPRMGCDHIKRRGVVYVRLFQSTHPVWDATAKQYKISNRFCTILL